MELITNMEIPRSQPITKTETLYGLHFSITQFGIGRGNYPRLKYEDVFSFDSEQEAVEAGIQFIKNFSRRASLRLDYIYVKTVSRTSFSAGFNDREWYSNNNKGY